MIGRRQHRDDAAERQAVAPTNIPVVAVVSPKGGNGKTTVSSNLAVGLAHRTDTVIIDLDIHFGDVEYALRMRPAHRLDDLVEAGNRRDPMTMLSTHPSGLDVLCAPNDPVAADRLSVDDAFAVVDRIIAAGRPVVLDTAGGISDYSLGALDRATRVVMVCGTDVPSVQAGRKLLDTMRRLDMDLDRVDLLVNRADAHVGLSVDDVETALGRHAVITIPEHSSLAAGMNSGSPVTESSPRSPIAAAFRQYADVLLGIDMAAAVTGRRS